MNFSIPEVLFVSFLIYLCHLSNLGSFFCFLWVGFQLSLGFLCHSSFEFNMCHFRHFILITIHCLGVTGILRRRRNALAFRIARVLTLVLSYLRELMFPLFVNLLLFRWVILIFYSFFPWGYYHGIYLHYMAPIYDSISGCFQSAKALYRFPCCR